jgi:hypothetical protein
MRLVPLFLAVAAMACDPMSMERIPSEAEIRNWDALKPFVAGCGEIRGVYQNLDVDSVVFHCDSRFESESEFWRLIAQQAIVEGWVEGTTITGGSVIKSFQRLEGRRGQQQFSSSEETRVAWTPQRVIVGYVQADHSGEPMPVGKTGEGAFAETSVWPQFNRLLSQ